MKSKNLKDKAELKHVAFIMDGNGRWARKRLLPRSAGHKEGLKAIEAAVKAAKKQGIPYVSFFAFSTENWNRPKGEVDSLMSLLKTKLPEMAKKLWEENLRLHFIGDITVFDDQLKDVLLQAEVLTRDCTEGAVGVALNYGGRQEIINAANKAVKTGKKIMSDEDFKTLLYCNYLPDPDLLIRTGGEKRISNFFLFQTAYTELYFSDKLWPDFTEADFAEAIEDYKKRDRRFGKL